MNLMSFLLSHKTMLISTTFLKKKVSFFTRSLIGYATGNNEEKSASDTTSYFEVPITIVLASMI